MLSVARAAAEAASAAVPRAPRDLGAQMGHVVSAASKAARVALQRTQEQLDVLRLAGVVDAGGLGLCVLFDAGVQALTGTRLVAIPATQLLPRLDLGSRLVADQMSQGPHFEVMYLLDAPQAAIPLLKQKLGPLGDSLVIVGGDELWNVHVHVDDVGAAIEAGIEAGRPYRVRVTHFADQLSRSPSDDPSCVEQTRAVVAVAAGPGLAELFEAAGAVVVHGGLGRRCTAGELLEAMRSMPSRQIVILPNDSHTLAVAETAATAARAEGTRVAVIPTRAQVQALAALAVHDGTRPFDDDVVQMTAAAGHARHGAVTVATRAAMTSAGPCRQGDALGVVEGDFVLVGPDVMDVALDVVEKLLHGDEEMVTLVRGADASDDLVRRVEAHVAAVHAGVEVVLYDGGQARYPLLIGVE
ncbi:MAG: DAK2 domain-containing protein [Nocardioidaceae bacterium]